MIRSILVFALIAIGVSVPVLMTSTNQSRQDSSDFSANLFDRSSGFQQQSAFQPISFDPANSPIGFIPNANANGANSSPIFWPGPTQPPSRVYQPVRDLKGIFRFDIYPNWVKSQWPRVSNTPGELQLEGMRVPLVTGQTPGDLTGSLTYYFDDRHQVQRICFQGWTGDASRLVQLLTEDFNFKTQTTSQAGMYTKRKWGRVHSLLRLDHLPMVRRDDPQKQMFVYLELNHPKGNLPLSTLGEQAIAKTN